MKNPIFIVNFGNDLPDRELRRMATISDTHWVYYHCVPKNKDTDLLAKLAMIREFQEELEGLLDYSEEE
jgi:hypothetical protein